jgi:hypothetical protein
MPEQQLLEVLLTKELRGLCMNCAKFQTCSYRQNAVKIIIQCELYELSEEEQTPHLQESIKLKGLCTNCCSADTCDLPDKQSGVWHCEEYR